jgi:hypothetical protein
VAVLGSHGICFAAMVQLAADGLAASLLAGSPPERLGEVLLRLKKGLAAGKIDDLSFRLLDAVDGDPTISQATQRREHLEMFLLLGDPALKLARLPDDVRLRVDGEALAGGTVTVTGQVPGRLEGARVRLTVERPVTSVPEGIEPLPQDPAARDRALRANWERANRFAVAEATAAVKGGRFEARVALPARLPWPRLVVRAYAATDREDGQGVVVVPVVAPRAGVAPEKGAGVPVPRPAGGVK